MKIVHREQYTDASAESIEIEREQLLAASDRIEKEYVTGNEQLQGYNSERDRIQVRLDINRNELKKEQTARESLEQQLQSELEESNFRSEEEVIAILSETISTEKEKQNIKAFYEELLKENRHLSNTGMRLENVNMIVLHIKRSLRSSGGRKISNNKKPTNGEKYP